MTSSIKKLQQRQKEAEEQLNKELERFGADVDLQSNLMAKPNYKKQKTSRQDGIASKPSQSLSQTKDQRGGSLNSSKHIFTTSQQSQYQNTIAPKPPAFKRYTPFEPAKLSEDGQINEPSKPGGGVAFKKGHSVRTNSAAVYNKESNGVSSELLSTNVSTQQLSSTGKNFGQAVDKTGLQQQSLPTITEKAGLNPLMSKNGKHTLRPPNKRGLPMMIPAIDHNRAKEKLQQIINSTESSSTLNKQGANLSVNRKQFSDGSNDGNNNAQQDDEHTKLIKSLPSFKNANDTKRGFSQDNQSYNNSQKRSKEGGDSDKNAIERKKRQMSNQGRKIIIGQTHTVGQDEQQVDLNFSHVPKIGGRPMKKRDNTAQKLQGINQDINQVMDPYQITQGSGANSVANNQRHQAPKKRQGAFNLSNISQKNDVGNDNSRFSQSPSKRNAYGRQLASNSSQDQIQIQKQKSSQRAKSIKAKQIEEEAKPKEKKPPSKYMLHLIRLNFIDLVHRYDQHQKVKRIQAMKRTRAHLTGRFLKLYRLFRHKKYGEPFDENQKTWTLDENGFDLVTGQYIPQKLQDQEHLIYKKIEELKKALGSEKENKSPDRANISDLHTVNEDYDDEQDDDDEFNNMDPNLNPNKFVRSTREYEDHVLNVVESNVIMNQIKEYMQNVKKVKRFLLMVIQRHRFLKKRAAIQLLQRYTKSFKAWKVMRKELVQERDFRKVEALKFYIRKASDVQRDRMDQAASKIQRSIYQKVKRRNQGKKLREELKKLPMVVRSNFVKMFLLKNQTTALNKQAKTYFRRY